MLTHLPASATPGDVVAVLDRDGACIVDDVLPTDTRNRFLEEVAPFVESTPFGFDDFGGKLTRRTGALIARSPSFRPIAAHPLLLGVADEVLGRFTNYQIHLTQLIEVGPESPAQALHRDQWAYDLFPIPQGVQVQLNSMWAIDEFTAANGATRIVPGSHLEPEGVHYEPGDSVPAEMAEGSVLIFVGSVFHGAGENTSRGVRRGLNVDYNAGFLRQEENQYLSIPQHIAAELPEDLLRLAGYQLGAYSLGYAEDVCDPLTALHRRVEENKSFYGR